MIFAIFHSKSGVRGGKVGIQSLKLLKGASKCFPKDISSPQIVSNGRELKIFQGEFSFRNINLGLEQPTLDSFIRGIRRFPSGIVDRFLAKCYRLFTGTCLLLTAVCLHSSAIEYICIIWKAFCYTFLSRCPLSLGVRDKKILPTNYLKVLRGNWK